MEKENLKAFYLIFNPQQMIQREIWKLEICFEIYFRFDKRWFL